MSDIITVAILGLMPFAILVVPGAIVRSALRRAERERKALPEARIV